MVLLKNNVLTSDDAEEVLCERTNSKKNYKLVDFVRSRFNRAFNPFCDALVQTNQEKLVDLLTLGSEATDALRKTQERNDNTCAVCLDNAINVVLIPCGHMCSCSQCSNKLSNCPICRSAIVQRVHVFHPSSVL